MPLIYQNESKLFVSFLAEKTFSMTAKCQW